MPDRMVERRAAPRYPLILIAEVTELPSGTKLSARTSDVSRTGCYVDMLNPIPPGSKIRLKLLRDDETFEVNAKVIYISQGLGMGVAFEACTRGPLSDFGPLAGSGGATTHVSC